MAAEQTRHYIADLDPFDSGLMPFAITFLGDDEDQPWEINCDEVNDTHETLDQLLFWNLILGARFISEGLRERINREWITLTTPPPDTKVQSETRTVCDKCKRVRENVYLYQSGQWCGTCISRYERRVNTQEMYGRGRRGY